MNKWLTININLPKLDVEIVARTAKWCGFEPSHKIFHFDSKVISKQEAADDLDSASFIEWMEL